MAPSAALALVYHAVAVGDLPQVVALTGLADDDAEANDALWAPQGPNRTTLLHLACAKGNARTVSALLGLLRRGTKLDKVLRAREDAKCGGFTALHHASEAGDAQVVRMLLEAGADPDSKELGLQFTPLHLAVRARQFEAAKLLAVLGADINARDAFGNNAAYWLHELRERDGALDEDLERLLGPPRVASIEERFFAIHRDRTRRHLPTNSLPDVPLKEVPSYKARMPKGKGGKKKGGKKKKGGARK